MPENKEITSLISTVNTFINEVHKSNVDSASRTAKLEANQENLNNQVAKFSEIVGDAVAVNSRLEIKITSLEEKSLGKIELFENQIDRIFTTQKNIDARVYEIEIYKKANQATFDAIVAAEEKQRSRSHMTFTKIVGLITVIGIVFGMWVSYQNNTKSVRTPIETPVDIEETK